MVVSEAVADCLSEVTVSQHLPVDTGSDLFFPLAVSLSCFCKLLYREMAACAPFFSVNSSRSEDHSEVSKAAPAVQLNLLNHHHFHSIKG